MRSRREDISIKKIASSSLMYMCVKYLWFNSRRSFQIRASSSCENVPQHIRFRSPSPPCPTRQCVSARTSSGICFSATFLKSFYGSHKCTDKNQSYFLLSPLCMFSFGSRQSKIRSRHSTVTVCPLLDPFATCSLWTSTFVWIWSLDW